MSATAEQVWSIGVEDGSRDDGGVVGCVALVGHAGSTMLLWQHRDWLDSTGGSFHWTVTDDAGIEWPRRGGGYGGGVSPEGRFDGGGSWRFDAAPVTGDRIWVRCVGDSRVALHASVVLQPALERQLVVSVRSASSGSGGLTRDLAARLVENGWRRGRAVPDELVAVSAPPIAFGEYQLRVLALERWGNIRRLMFRVGGGPLDPVPLWWDLEVDGVRCQAITDGVQGGAGGELGYLAAVEWAHASDVLAG